MRRQLVGLIALAWFGLLASTVAQATPLSDGLLGYWQFEGSGADSSGNGNTLTLNGAAGYGPGLFGQALSLNGTIGTNASMTTNNTAFDFGSSDFTVQAWAKFNAAGNPASSIQILIEKFFGGTGPGWTLYTDGNTIQFYADGASVSLVGGVSNVANSWEQFVITRTGNVWDLYWDDNLVATTTIAHSLSGTTNPLLFGARDPQDSDNFTLNGLEDEVAIWNRGLSASDIAVLWNNGSGEQIPVQVPEPASLMLLVVGLLGLGMFRRPPPYLTPGCSPSIRGRPASWLVEVS